MSSADDGFAILMTLNAHQHARDDHDAELAATYWAEDATFQRIGWPENGSVIQGRDAVMKFMFDRGHAGTWGPGAGELGRLAAAIEQIPTEASAMALRCARGESAITSIRDGRRTVQLTAVGGLLFFFDAVVALGSAARCAQLVRHAGSLTQANDVLLARGIATELSYETQRAVEQ